MAIKKVARIGDPGTHGGTLVNPSVNTTIAGSKVAVQGDMYNCPTHGMQSVTATGLLRINGKKVIREGDLAGCGASITGVSSSTKSD